jgi:hypothetical protein
MLRNETKNYIVSTVLMQQSPKSYHDKYLLYQYITMFHCGGCFIAPTV